VCQSLIPNEHSYTEKELIELQDTQLKNVIAADIYAIWLGRYQVLFDRLKSNHVRVYYDFHFDSNKVPDYRVFITEENHTETQQVPTLDVKNF